jgi:hypothetical protein
MSSPLLAFESVYPQQKKIFFSQWQLEPQLLMVYPIISLTTGKQQGYLFAELALKNLFNAFPRQKIGQGKLFLVNFAGAVVSHGNLNYVLKGSKVDHLLPIANVLQGELYGLGQYLNLDREAVLGVAVRIEGLPLMVVSEIPIAQTYAFSYALRNTFVYVFCFTLSLILFGSWYLSRSMTQPIERLYRATE